MLPVYIGIGALTVAIGLKAFGGQTPAKDDDVAIIPSDADSVEESAPATEGAKRDSVPVAVTNLKCPISGKFIKRN